MRELTSSITNCLELESCAVFGASQRYSPKPKTGQEDRHYSVAQGLLFLTYASLPKAHAAAARVLRASGTLTASLSGSVSKPCYSAHRGFSISIMVRSTRTSQPPPATPQRLGGLVANRAAWPPFTLCLRLFPLHSGVGSAIRRKSTPEAQNGEISIYLLPVK